MILFYFISDSPVKRSYKTTQKSAVEPKPSIRSALSRYYGKHSGSLILQLILLYKSQAYRSFFHELYHHHSSIYLDSTQHTESALYLFFFILVGYTHLIHPVKMYEQYYKLLTKLLIWPDLVEMARSVVHTIVLSMVQGSWYTAQPTIELITLYYELFCPNGSLLQCILEI